MNKFLKHVTTHAFAIFGAFSLVSILADLTTLPIQEDIKIVIDAFRAVTRPIWQLVFSLINVRLHGWMYDWLSIWLIVSGMNLRRVMFLWRDVNGGGISGLYRTFFLFYYVTVFRGQNRKFYYWFIPLSFAHNLVFWPEYLFWSLKIYYQFYFGDKSSFDNSKTVVTSLNLYFLTLFWTLAIICLLFGFFYLD